MLAPDPDPQPDPDELVQLNIRVPRSLRDQIDARRALVVNKATGKLGVSQAMWLTNAARFALRQHPAPTTAPGRRTARP